MSDPRSPHAPFDKRHRGATRRLGVSLTAFALVVAACSGDPTSTTLAPSTTSTTATTTSATPASTTTTAAPTTTVGVATTGVALALLIGIHRRFGTLEETEILRQLRE